MFTAIHRNVRARGPVEQWLDGVETAMFETVRRYDLVLFIYSFREAVLAGQMCVYLS